MKSASSAVNESPLDFGSGRTFPTPVAALGQMFEENDKPASLKSVFELAYACVACVNAKEWLYQIPEQIGHVEEHA